MNTLESILAGQTQIKTLQDLIKSDKFKSLAADYDFDKVKGLLPDDSITRMLTTVRFTEHRFDISQLQHVSGRYGYIGQINQPIASILLKDEISIRDIDLKSVDDESEFVEDLKKIFFN